LNDLTLNLNGNDSSLYPSQRTQVCVYIDREMALLEGFGHESFPLKFNVTTFKYNIHSVEVDLHYLK